MLCMSFLLSKNTATKRHERKINVEFLSSVMDYCYWWPVETYFEITYTVDKQVIF